MLIYGHKTYNGTSRVKVRMIAHTGMRDRGVKFANFQVLRDTKMPAILIEGGFVDSTDRGWNMNSLTIEPVVNAVTVELFDVYTTTYFLSEVMTLEDHKEVE